MQNPLDQRRKLPASEVMQTIERGVMAQKARDFPKAEFFYQTVLRDHPKHPDALNLMGTIALEAKKSGVAAGYFRKAVKQVQRNPIFLYNLGSAQLAERKPQLAIETLRKVALMKPDYLQTWVLLGRAYVGLGQQDEALDAFDRALSLRPDDFAVALERAEVLVNLGRLAEAADIFRHAIANNEQVARAMIGLSVAHKFTPDDPEPALMVDLLNSDPKATRRKALRYAAGKALADQKRFDAAFEQFSMAKQEADNAFAIDVHRDTFDRTKKLITAPFLAERADIGGPSTRPVFIVGMPRSGTTLTEQILASHPHIAGAGELTDLRRIASDLGYGHLDKTLFGRNLESLTEGRARKIAGHYLAALKRHSSGSALRVVDKMPHNYEFVGLIAILFPNARIIHCKRSPMDTCVSCFTQNFSDAHGYNGDLRTLGQYYKAYDDLMVHWHSVLPGRILDSRYEELIADQEAASRRLIAWTGLDWDDACLSFQKTERLVTTPSRWQVRQPIYKTSVKKWEKYGKHLGPLEKALGHLAQD